MNGSGWEEAMTATATAMSSSSSTTTTTMVMLEEELSLEEEEEKMVANATTMNNGFNRSEDYFEVMYMEASQQTTPFTSEI